MGLSMLFLGFLIMLYFSLRLPSNQSKANPAVAFSLTWLVIGFGVEMLPFFVSIPFLCKSYILFNGALFVLGGTLGSLAFYNKFSSEPTFLELSKPTNSSYIFNTLLVLVGVVLLAIGMDMFIYWQPVALAAPRLAQFFLEVRAAALQGESLFNALSYLHRTASA